MMPRRLPVAALRSGSSGKQSISRQRATRLVIDCSLMALANLRQRGKLTQACSSPSGRAGGNPQPNPEEYSIFNLRLTGAVTPEDENTA